MPSPSILPGRIWVKLGLRGGLVKTSDWVSSIRVLNWRSIFQIKEDRKRNHVFNLEKKEEERKIELLLMADRKALDSNGVNNATFLIQSSNFRNVISRFAFRPPCTLQVWAQVEPRIFNFERNIGNNIGSISVKPFVAVQQIQCVCNIHINFVQHGDIGVAKPDPCLLFSFIPSLLWNGLNGYQERSSKQ